jgi:hypothetical protein
MESSKKIKKGQIEDYISSSTQTVLDLKVDKVVGKELSTNDYTDVEKSKLEAISGTNTGDETAASIQTKRPLKTIEGQSLEGTGNIDLTKLDVGLANVDNTSDLNKPISTATQTALNLKENTITGGLVTQFFSGLKTFRDLATDVMAVTLNGFASTNAGISATDTILQGFNKAQGQINQRITQNGNSFGAVMVIGTNDAFNIEFRRAGALAGRIGLSNTFFGLNSGNTAAGGTNASFGVGAMALYTGTGTNCAFGGGALSQNVNGTGNVAVGFNALAFHTTNNSTGVGEKSGLNITGSDNLFLGFNASIETLGNGSNNIIIGANTNMVGGGNLSNQINIGNFLYKTSTGNFGIDINGATEKLHVNGGLRVTGAYKDSSNASGTSGQVLSSTVTGTAWVTVGTGTVTSVGLTLNSTGADINITGSPITSNGAFTLSIPTASATNRGALSSSDWSTFNNKQTALISGTNIKTINGETLLGAGDIVISGGGGGSGLSHPQTMARISIGF